MLENKFYLEEFIAALSVYSMMSEKDYPPSIKKDVCSEVIKTTIMAIREGKHIFLKDIESLAIRRAESLGSFFETFPIDFLTLSYVPQFAENKREQAHILVIRTLLNNVISFTLWITDDLQVWQPIPLYSIFSMKKFDKVPMEAEPYTYWVYNCLTKTKRNKMLYQAKIEDISNDEMEYMNHTLIEPAIYQLFLGFWRGYTDESFTGRDKLIPCNTILHDEEGDLMQLNNITYYEIEGIK